MKVYGPENNRNYRYVLVIIDNFSKFGWTVRLKNEDALSKRDSFEIFLIGSKRKSNLIEIGLKKFFIFSFFKIFRKIIKLNFIQEVAHLAALLLNVLIVLLEISLKNQFLNKKMVIGLMYYLQ